MSLALALSLALSLAPPDPIAPPPEPAANVSFEVDPVPIEAAPRPAPRELVEPEPGEPEPASEPVRALEPARPPAIVQPDLRFRLAIDLPITLGFASVWALTEGFKQQTAPRDCRWCTPSPVGRATRLALVWRDPEAAALTSDIVAYGLIPALSLTLTLIAVGREGEWKKLHEDLLIALEAVAVTAALTNVIKMSSGRTRPYAEFASEPIPFADDPDQNLSFPSGHSSFAFAFASSFATVATLRKRKLAPVFWGVGMPAAALVGYLRMAGDRHWLGDVLVGASLGTVIGVGLPWLLHHPRTGVTPRRARDQARARALRLSPMPGGLLLAGQL